MPLLQSHPKLVTVQLARNLTRAVKRGHAWLYADALRAVPDVSPGTPAILLDNKGGNEIARGYLHPASPLALRVCSTMRGTALNENWIRHRLEKSLATRNLLFTDEHTNAYRLVNGEGDGLPGLVIDRYAEFAVIKLDGAGPEGFYNAEGIAEWLSGQGHAHIENVLQRFKSGADALALVNALPDAPVEFREHGMRLRADLVHGQKTGFFLDQRENRRLIGLLSAGARVLNVFGYTGGFSVAAGLGGAAQVATVDLAAPAIAMAAANWALNDLPPEAHAGHAVDAVDYLEAAAKDKQEWDVVILDPPSFAPNEDSVPAAVNAYTRLIALGARVTAPGGLLAAASCSSHIRREQFLTIIEEALSAARRTGITLGVHGNPADHPAPLVMPELRYLKFTLLRLD
jgi:23S rRNA (cytosine1962-C5)-methyltransferase